jgi:hypothetical protein
VISFRCADLLGQEDDLLPNPQRYDYPYNFNLNKDGTLQTPLGAVKKMGN